jgi:predicted GH43/DUF377 family glycosyl hydrolase
MLTQSVSAFTATRLGVIMSPDPGSPHESWGVLNPGGMRGPDGTMHLFPRLIAEGNYSRIGHARVHEHDGAPVRVERLDIALAPAESYERSSGGGGVEDARVAYVPRLGLYVMTYTAFVPYEPRVAMAVSEDLVVWRRLGVVHFEVNADGRDLNTCGNKDAAVIAEPVSDPYGVPSLALLHRPTTRVRLRVPDTAVTLPPSGDETRENIWISYVALADVLADVGQLSHVRRHEHVMAPAHAWEMRKVGTGAPPVRLPYGWVLPYHAVSTPDGHPHYAMGMAVLDLERPSRVLYRTPSPILEPEAPYECNGLVADVVFPSAADLRTDGTLDVYYGAADRCIAAARVTLPRVLPV